LESIDIEETGAGTISEGFIAASIFNRGPGAGTVNGVSLPINGLWSRPPVSGQVYDAVDYDAGGNTFVVSQVRR